MLLNFNPTPRKVTIEFEDGSIETFEIGEKCGFLREAYTYQDDAAGRICAVLHTYELYWSEVKESVDAFYSRPSKTDR
jgi:hypothetical protein